MRVALILALALASPALAADPETTFLDNCAACHQAGGQGVPGAFPALAANPFVTGPADQVINTVLNGRGGMPAFRDELSDEQLAGVIGYIRGGWGNRAKTVAPADIAAERTAPPKARSLQAH